MDTYICPHGQSSEDQIKYGLNPSGSQRYQCHLCGRVYTPTPTSNGYDAQTRHEAVQLYLDGMNLRRVARTLGVNHQSVANWVKAAAMQLPLTPMPAQVETLELDELFTFVEKKSPPT